MKPVSASRGFTLVELMVVIALLAIFASIAVPSFNTLIANIRTETAASELHSLLVSARSNAVTQRTRVTLEKVDASNWQVKHGNTVSGTLVLPPSVSIAPDNITSLSFNPDGSAGQTTTLRLNNDRSNKYYEIRVLASGVTRLSFSTS